MSWFIKDCWILAHMFIYEGVNIGHLAFSLVSDSLYTESMLVSKCEYWI